MLDGCVSVTSSSSSSLPPRHTTTLDDDDTALGLLVLCLIQSPFIIHGAVVTDGNGNGVIEKPHKTFDADDGYPL